MRVLRSPSFNSRITFENHVIHSFRSFCSMLLMRWTSSKMPRSVHASLVLFLSASRILSINVLESLIFDASKSFTDTRIYSKSTIYLSNCSAWSIIFLKLCDAVHFRSPLYRTTGMMAGSRYSFCFRMFLSLFLK